MDEGQQYTGEDSSPQYYMGQADELDVNNSGGNFEM